MLTIRRMITIEPIVLDIMEPQALGLKGYQKGPADLILPMVT